MKQLTFTALLIASLLACSLTACNTFKAAGVTSITASRAMQGWAHYYDEAIQDPAAFDTTTARLNEQRAKVDRAWDAYRLAMNTTDDTRQAGGDVAAALRVASQRSEELVAIVLSFLPQKYQPKGSP